MRSVDDLLGDADIAMYQAKALGKGRHHVFDAASTDGSRRPARAWVDTRARPSAGRRRARALGVARLEPGAG